jgi:hypothetical protein
MYRGELHSFHKEPLMAVQAKKSPLKKGLFLKK